MMHSNVIAVPHTPVAVPSIALVGGRDREAKTPVEQFAEVRIEWTAGPDDRLVSVDDSTLSAFVALADAPFARLASAVERLARAHGPLFSAVCARASRAKTLTHPHNPADLDVCRPYAVEFGPLERAIAGREAVMTWRNIATRFATILDVASGLAADRVGDPRKWAILTGSAGVGPRESPFPATAAVGRLILQAAIRDLFVASGVRLVLDAEREPALSLTGDGLFGALTVQLALRISGLASMAICAECGAIVPDRTPDTRRAFCTIHRTPQVKNKWAARDYRRDHPKRTKGATR